jgi:hypothetical protein
VCGLVIKLVIKGFKGFVIGAEEEGNEREEKG